MRAYVSIGSNIERERNVRAAVRRLRERYGPITLSSVYESEAVGFEGSPFYNLTAGLDTEEGPAEVAGFLRTVEAGAGRDRGQPRFSSRTLDLDLLLWGDAAIEQEGLHLPREEILTHAFVLGPLAEIAGAKRHPLEARTYAELWAAFDHASQPMRRVAFDAEGTAAMVERP